MDDAQEDTQYTINSQVPFSPFDWACLMLALVRAAAVFVLVLYHSLSIESGTHARH